MTPLEKALQINNKKCCSNCKNKIIVNNVNYCIESGKIILEIHLESDRSKQCELRFK